MYVLDSHGVEASTGAACTAGVAQGSHVLLAMGRTRAEASSTMRFSLGHSSTGEDVAALLRHLPEAVEAARRVGDRAPAASARDGEVTPVKVLAALSGGVDSAVAAARAVDAGHDVVGIHMALSRNRDEFRTGSRGCCSLEDSNDARRAADRLGIPYYVWDLSDEFEERVVADFLSEYAAGRTPNPCVRCNQHIKFEALLERATTLGFDAVCTGHYARIDRARRRDAGTPSRGRRREGPVLRPRRHRP